MPLEVSRASGATTPLLPRASRCSPRRTESWPPAGLLKTAKTRNSDRPVLLRSNLSCATAPSCHDSATSLLCSCFWSLGGALYLPSLRGPIYTDGSWTDYTIELLPCSVHHFSSVASLIGCPLSFCRFPERREMSGRAGVWFVLIESADRAAMTGCLIRYAFSTYYRYGSGRARASTRLDFYIAPLYGLGMDGMGLSSIALSGFVAR
jgi:hypothetical protein